MMIKKNRITKEEQITFILDWVKEWQDDVIIFSYDNGNEYKVFLPNNKENLSFVVKREWQVFCYFYNITFVNGISSDYYYAHHNKLVKKLFKFVKELYNSKKDEQEGGEMDIFEEQVWKMLKYDPDDEFDFGEPMHPENLPDCGLEKGKYYLVPMVLTDKERRFDGGRGTEYYEFEYLHTNSITKSIRISDKHMSKRICEFSLDKEE